MLYNEDASIPVPASTMLKREAKQRAQTDECAVQINATEMDIPRDVQLDIQTAPVNDSTHKHSASTQPLFRFGVHRDNVSHDTDDESGSSEEYTDSSDLEDSS